MGTLFQLIFSFNNLQVYKCQLEHISGIVKPSWRANVHGETIFRRCHIFPAMASSNQTPAGGDWVLSVKHALRSYPVFEPILIIIRLQNPDNTSKASKSLPNSRLKNLFQTSKSRQKSSFKFQCQTTANLDQSSASTSWPNFSFTVVTKIRVQNLYQTSASKSRLKCRQHVPQHQHIRNNNNLKKFLFGIFENQSHISQVSQWVNHKGSQWSDLGLIKISFTAILIPDHILMAKTMASPNLTL